MTINIEKKQILIGSAIIAAIIIIAIGFGMIRNSVYLHHAKDLQESIYKLDYMSELLSSELHDVWSDYILEDKKIVDRNTGKFYKGYWNTPADGDIHHCGNFSEAITEKANYYEDKGINDELDSLYTRSKKLITKMTPAPKKYAYIHTSLSQMFHTAEAMYNCAVSPEGSLRSYTETINTLTADFKKHKSQVDIELGEMDEDAISEFKLDCLIKFLSK